MNVFKWRPMQHEKDLNGDVLVTLWKSKRVAWHWVALYRRNHTVGRPLFYEATRGYISLNWNFSGRQYHLYAQDYAGLIPKSLRWTHYAKQSK